MTGIEVVSVAGVLITVIGWLRGELGDKGTRDKILKVLEKEESWQRFLEKARKLDIRDLSNMIKENMDYIVECITQLDRNSYQRFNELLAEIRRDNAELMAQVEEQANSALRLSFKDIFTPSVKAKAELTENDLRPSYLLDAKREVVPFHGRTQELADLDAWAEKDQPLAVRLYEAPGGMGKTRLLHQLCHDLNDKGWITGFLAKDIEDFTRRDIRCCWLYP